MVILLGRVIEPTPGFTNGNRSASGFSRLTVTSLRHDLYPMCPERTNLKWRRLRAALSIEYIRGGIYCW